MTSLQTKRLLGLLAALTIGGGVGACTRTESATQPLELPEDVAQCGNAVLSSIGNSPIPGLRPQDDLRGCLYIEKMPCVFRISSEELAQCQTAGGPCEVNLDDAVCIGTDTPSFSEPLEEGDRVTARLQLVNPGSDECFQERAEACDGSAFDSLGNDRQCLAEVPFRFEVRDGGRLVSSSAQRGQASAGLLEEVPDFETQTSTSCTAGFDFNDPVRPPQPVELRVEGLGTLTASADGSPVLECVCSSEPCAPCTAEVDFGTELSFSVTPSADTQSPRSIVCTVGGIAVDDCLESGLTVTGPVVGAAKFLKNPRTVRIVSLLPGGEFCGGQVLQVQPAPPTPDDPFSLRCPDVCETQFEGNSLVELAGRPANPEREDFASPGFSVQSWSIRECRLDDEQDCRDASFPTCPVSEDAVDELRRCLFTPLAVTDETRFYEVGIEFGSSLEVTVDGMGEVSSDDPSFSTDTAATVSQVCTHTATLTAMPEDGWQLLQWVDDADMTQRPCARPPSRDFACETREQCPVRFGDLGEVRAVLVEEGTVSLEVERGPGAIVCQGAADSIPLCWETNERCRATSNQAADCAALPTQVLDCVAEPSNEAIFRRWSGGPCAESTDDTCQTSVDEAQPDIIAVFGFELDVEIQNGGGGTVQCNSASCDDAEYDAGDTVTVTAQPAGNAIFRRWEGPCTSNEPTECEVTMTEKREVRAVFGYEFTIPEPAAGSGTLTVNAANGQADIVCAGGTCTVSADHGADVTVNAATSNGSTFSQWTGCMGAGMVQGNQCQIMNIQAPLPGLQALFDYPVTLVPPAGGSLSVDGQAGTCGSSCDYTVRAGSPLTINANTQNGSELRNFLNDCDGQNSCSFASVTGPVTVGAVFTYTLTLVQPVAGSGTLRTLGVTCGDDAAPDPDCTIKVDADTANVNITPTGTNGGTFDRWGACPGTAEATCRITMDANKTVEGVFTYTLNLDCPLASAGSFSVPGCSCTAAANGPTEACEIDAGDTVTVTSATNNGSEFENFVGGPCDGITANTCNVTMNQGSDGTTVAGLFVYQVTATADGSGVFSTSSPVKVEAGETFTVTADTSGAGSSVVNDWTVSCTGGSSCTTSPASGCTDPAAGELYSQSNNGSCEVTVTGDTTVTAEFAYEVRVDVAGGTPGSPRSLDIAPADMNGEVICTDNALVNVPCGVRFATGGQAPLVVFSPDPSLANNEQNKWEHCPDDTNNPDDGLVREGGNWVCKVSVTQSYNTQVDDDRVVINFNN